MSFVAVKNTYLSTLAVLSYNLYTLVWLSIFVITGLNNLHNIITKSIDASLSTIFIEFEIVCIFLTLKSVSNIYDKLCPKCHICCQRIIMKCIDIKPKDKLKFPSNKAAPIN